MATRGSNKSDNRSSTRNANANAATSGTKRDNTTSASNQQSRGAAGQSSTNASSPSTASTTASRGDQQRDLQTTQERGAARPGSPPRRAELDQSSRVQTSGSLAGSSPFSVMRRMMEDMDRLFSSFASSSERGSEQGLQRGSQRGLQPLTRGLWAPQVEVFERGSNVVVRAELPGLSREDVDVEVEDDMLVIRGERHNDVEDEHDGYYRSERSYGSFYRALPLPEGVEASACNAMFKDGVLEVTLPKPAAQVSRAKKINVR